MPRSLYMTNCDRGTVTSRQYWEHLCHAADRGPDPTPIDTAAIDTLIRLDALSWKGTDHRVLDWAWRIEAAGQRIGILSNMPHDELRLFRAEFDWFARFEIALFSCEFGGVKPEGPIYEELIRRFALPPEQILFIDDRQENVDGARAVGLRAQLFPSFEQAAADWAWATPAPQ